MSEKWQMVRLDRGTWKLAKRVRDALQKQTPKGDHVPLYAAIMVALHDFEKLLKHLKEDIAIVSKSEVERMNRREAESAVKIAELQINAELQSLAIEWLVDHAVALEGCPGNVDGKVETLRRARVNAGEELLKAYVDANEMTRQIAKTVVMLNGKELSAMKETEARLH